MYSLFCKNLNYCKIIGRWRKKYAVLKLSKIIISSLNEVFAEIQLFKLLKPTGHVMHQPV